MAALGVAGVLVLGASNADSQIILTPPVGQAQAPTNPHITGSSGSYQWAYSISIGYGTQISSGDSFAITDFGGFTNPTFTAASVSYTLGANSADFAVTAPLTYSFPAGASSTVYGDNPAITDAVVTYSGPTLRSNSTVTVGSYSIPISLLIGTLTLTTTTNAVSPTEGLIASTSEYYPATTNHDYYTAPADVPLASTPAGSLPLPAAFWPGLGTLVTIALVGGVKLRNRFI